jgi:hypothetical protein
MKRLVVWTFVALLSSQILDDVVHGEKWPLAEAEETDLSPLAGLAQFAVGKEMRPALINLILAHEVFWQQYPLRPILFVSVSLRKQLRELRKDTIRGIPASGRQVVDSHDASSPSTVLMVVGGS